MRRPVALRKPQPAGIKSFPAPVRGWIANENLAISKPQGAAELDNWFPTATGVRMRRGSARYATVGAGGPVPAMMTYILGASETFFAATETDIYDITTVVDADVSPAAAVSGLTGGEWQYVQFATIGDTRLCAVNGEDAYRNFDGTTWTTPAITGVASDELSFIWAWKRRLFFIQKFTMSAWYLDVDSFSGTATELPLGGVFTRGGSLIFGASWSLADAGEGLVAACVFVTSEGEVAVYKGTDPDTEATWSLVGVYRVGRPLGTNAFIRAGGDLIIATDIGFVPLSQAVQRDIAALSPSAVSYPIEDAWNETVAERGTTGWQCEVWPTQQMVVVSPPNEGYDPISFMANARTGSWGRYTGWKVRSIGLLRNRMFFGTEDGRVIEAEVTGFDEGLPYTSVCVPLFDDLKTPASLKTAGLARATLIGRARPEPQLSMMVDYTIDLPTAPDAASAADGPSVWGTALWGEGVWSEPPDKKTYADWQAVSGAGYALAPALQITSGISTAPDVDLVRIDVSYETGDIVS